MERVYVKNLYFEGWLEGPNPNNPGPDELSERPLRQSIEQIPSSQPWPYFTEGRSNSGISSFLEGEGRASNSDLF